MLKRILLYVALLFGSLCFASIFALVFLNGTEITCNRLTNGTFTCNTKTLLLGRFTIFEREVAQIVDVDIFDDGCFDDCAYRAEFITSDGDRVALNEVYTDYDPVSKRVGDLKRLMDSGESSFEYEIKPLWWVAFLIGGLFLMEAVVLTLTMGVSAVRDYMNNRDRLPQ